MTRVGKGLADLSPRRLPRHHPSFLRSAAPPLCPALDLSWLLPHPWGTGSGTHLSTPAYSRIAVLASCLLLGQLYFSWLSAFCRFSCISVMWPPQPHYLFSGICFRSWKIPTGNPRPCPCSLPPPDPEVDKQLQSLPAPLSSAWPQDTLWLWLPTYPRLLSPGWGIVHAYPYSVKLF